MPVLQYQCQSCTSLFEHLVSKALEEQVGCLSCGGRDVVRVFATSYYPNKTFCPHDKKIEINDELLDGLGEILQSDDLRCRGCGVDGPQGSCSTGVASSGCGTCSCGKGGCGR